MQIIGVFRQRLIVREIRLHKRAKLFAKASILHFSARVCNIFIAALDVCKCMNKETAHSINYTATFSVGWIYDFSGLLLFFIDSFFTAFLRNEKIIDFLYLFSC